MKKYLEILKKCLLFKNICEDNLIPMLSCLSPTIKKYGKKEIIISEGDSADNIGIVLGGSVQIEQTDYFGNRSIVTTVETSEIFGETFACADVVSFPVDVVANENTEVMFIDCFKIMNCCSNTCDFHRQTIFNLMKIVANKNLILQQKITVTSKRSTREKLMAYLHFQAKKNSSKKFNIPFDRQELADFLQVERSGLSAEISKLRNEGVIKSKKNSFELLQ